MSEEILNALVQLFAIIAKQDEGVDEKEVQYVENFLTQQLGDETVASYLTSFKIKAGLEEEGSKKESEEPEEGKKKKPKLTSVKDSVRILGLCKKINRTLNQKQKVVVLVRLFELVNTSRKFTDQRMAIINTVAEVFNISKEEFNSIETFVVQNDFLALDNPALLIINDKHLECVHCKKINSETLDGSLIILRIQSSELYFLRYTGTQDVFLNGLGVYNNRIYLFATGSTIKLPKGKPIYYSDIVANFLSDKTFTKLSFDVRNVEYKFQSGAIGLRDINFSEQHGKLVGIMGASGAGKTTLLNLLSGMHEPTRGEVLINGINLHTEREKIEGVIGYIPQDDLLIEELTVFQNLYYNAKLCFKDKSEQEITSLVDTTLSNLGLYERKDLKVGNTFNKLISGGQRKRLNIALELIREPSILFVDEPTSGLSSRDSENVMDLLNELTLKGKLIFVVIHQPSSDVYKMFDKMIILDTGGYMAYYGNPVESIVYFKTIDGQINSEVGECPNCGNVTPEIIFNILEAKVVDEFGQYTPNRKISPTKWEEYYYSNVKIERVETVKEDPPKNLNIPKWIKQFKIYTVRDLLTKISNTQYIILNMGEAPLLGFILSFIVRYIADPSSSKYILYDNENIPPYIFMSIVVALFLGLTVSAEEIFRDRKILKREKFLNLSRSSYLVSKILILTVISAIQSILFVLVGNTILGIWGMYFQYWLALFSIFVFANMMGLNISATFNSAVTIYILIPLLMIPQMALGGAMFSFDKLNRKIGSVDKVPVIAEFMASRWAYEGLMVYQFKSNEFNQIGTSEENMFDINKRLSQADFKMVHYLPALTDNLNEAYFALIDQEDIEYDKDSLQDVIEDRLWVVRSELIRDLKRIYDYKINLINDLTSENIKNFTVEQVDAIIKSNSFLGKELIGEEEDIISLKDLKKSFLDAYTSWTELTENDKELSDTEATELDKKFEVVITNLINLHDAAFNQINQDLERLTLENFDEDVFDETVEYLDEYELHYSTIFQEADSKIEKIKNYLNEKAPGEYIYKRDRYHNEHLEDIVTKVYEKHKILRYKEKLVQQIDPIYMDPDNSTFIGFRSHFYAPQKYFLGQHFDTFWFNIIVIWIMSILLYFPLYYEHLKKILDFTEKINFGKIVVKLKKPKKINQTLKTKVEIKKEEDKEEEDKEEEDKIKLKKEKNLKKND
jgi:ABC-type multidrug transport system ATPase subunit